MRERRLRLDRCLQRAAGLSGCPQLMKECSQSLLSLWLVGVGPRLFKLRALALPHAGLHSERWPWDPGCASRQGYQPYGRAPLLEMNPRNFRPQRPIHAQNSYPPGGGICASWPSRCQMCCPSPASASAVGAAAPWLLAPAPASPSLGLPAPFATASFRRCLRKSTRRGKLEVVSGCWNQQALGDMKRCCSYPACSLSFALRLPASPQPSSSPSLLCSKRVCSCSSSPSAGSGTGTGRLKGPRRTWRGVGSRRHACCLGQRRCCSQSAVVGSHQSHHNRLRLQ